MMMRSGRIRRAFRTQSRVVTYETEADTSIPVGPGNLIGRGSLSYMPGVPDGDAVYDQIVAARAAALRKVGRTP